MKTVVVHIKGRVQGVFFRQSTREKARELSIGGTVRNLADGSVELVATGSTEQLDRLLAWCRQGPPRASVTGVEWTEREVKLFAGFEIIKDV